MNNKTMSINWRLLTLISVLLILWVIIAISQFSYTRSAVTISTMQWTTDTCWGGWMNVINAY